MISSRYLCACIVTEINKYSSYSINALIFLNKLHNNCIFRNHILTTDILSEKHTSEHIAHCIKTILIEWKILNKTVAIVTDNAANMKAAVRHLGYLHLPCAAHTLNLVVNDSLNGVPSIKNLLKTCKSLVGHFKTSVVAADKLRDVQNEVGLQELNLKQDVPTRWNSSLIMLERLLTFKVPVSAALASLSRNITSLDTEQWEIIEDFIPLLKPLEYVTTELSGEKYPTSSKIIPLVKGIQHAIQNIIPKTNAGLALRNNILNNIEIRFDYTETYNITLVSTILDSRFKTAVFENENIAQAAEDILKSELSSLCRIVTNTEVIENDRENQEQTQENANFWNFFVTNVSHLAKQSTPTENIKNCPINYWFKHTYVVPHIQKIAQKYLCIPATSVPSERVFSKAGQIMTERRNRLTPKNLNQLIFLNANIE